ncbi:MAG: DJ-1/PfpI family protein [Polyangiaceae bacterium]|nr:DJ-1/PfpI family protein [Myxococcales bacterium]MCB9587453.1 DJ-1/PfpI family protein [Polyangiaceae bacterium]MCB9605750.1 DJ-1/PfpI family protein [Polyangiaceae bacterium]
MKFGFVLFEDFEELDLVGPWEVLRMASRLLPADRDEWTCELVGPTLEPVRAAKGMRVCPDQTFAGAGECDVLVVPGGQGTRRGAEDPALLEFLARQSAGASWSFSICTGALLFFASGVNRGREVTTYFAFVDELQRRAGSDLKVRGDVRYVADDLACGPRGERRLLSAAGVSAGIDAALWLVGQLESPEFAQGVQRAIQYDPAPPYGLLEA